MSKKVNEMGVPLQILLILLLVVEFTMSGKYGKLENAKLSTQNSTNNLLWKLIF